MLGSRIAHFTAAVVLATSLSAVAQAQNIGIDWYGGNGTGDQTQMLAGDVAGVVPHGNWNSFLGTSGTALPLNFDTGAASGATITWANSPNDWDTNVVEATSANHKMMLGYLDTNDTSITNVTVSGLPASITTPGYLVYIYYDGDNGTGTGQHRAGRYEINGTSLWGRDAGNRFDGTFIQGQTSTDPTIASGGIIDTVPQAIMDAVPAGNYLIHGPIFTPEFTLNVQASVSAGATNRGPLNGMQIVPIPEPTSIALFAVAAIGGLGVAARRRMRRA